MTITTIDPHVALVLVDLQRGVVDCYTQVHPWDEVLSRAAELAAAFRAAGQPVVLVNVRLDEAVHQRTDVRLGGLPVPADSLEIVAQLDAQPSDIRVTKRNYGAFTGTDLDTILRRRGITQIVLAGVASSCGIESTARSAHDIGYEIAFAVDAMTDPSMTAHDNCVSVSFPILGEVGTTADVIALLPQRVTTRG
jgi:nicotinamidase-related amidase